MEISFPWRNLAASLRLAHEEISHADRQLGLPKRLGGEDVMVTITYEALNDLTHEVSDAIERIVGFPVETDDRFGVNDMLTSWLSQHGVQFEEGDE